MQLRKFYCYPANKKYYYPPNRKCPKSILPVFSKIAFGWINYPWPVKPNMKKQQHEKKKRQVKMNITPLMTMQTQKIFIDSFFFWNYKPHS